MKKLIKGIVEFRQKSLTQYRTKYAKLSEGQSPDVLFIACCDSRVVPNVFASTNPGDLFVVRNLGNLVPPHHTEISEKPNDSSVSAAIDYSLSFLNVKDIVICGHSECGAMSALLDHKTMPPVGLASFYAWLENAKPSYSRFLEAKINETPFSAVNLLSRINVLQQLDHLKTYPAVVERLLAKTLRIHGWWFDLATANVYHHNNDKTDDFILIDEQEAKKLL